MNVTNLKGSIGTVVKCVGSVATEIKVKGSIGTIVSIKGSVAQFIVSNIFRAISFAKCTILPRMKVFRKSKTFIMPKAYIIPSLRAIRKSKSNIIENIKVIPKMIVYKYSKSLIKHKVVIGRYSNLGILDPYKLEVLDNLTLEMMEFVEGVVLNIKKVMRGFIVNKITISASMSIIKYIKLEVHDTKQLNTMDSITLQDLDRITV